MSVIAATNRDLRVEAAAGRFRSDLYYRLSILEIHLPPLRERREDIPYLTAAFVHDCAERLKRPITGLTASAERLLQHAPWPGNIRELRNVIERACIMSDGRMLTERELRTGDVNARRHKPASRRYASSTVGRSASTVDRSTRSDPPRDQGCRRQQSRSGKAARRQPPLPLPLARSPRSRRLSAFARRACAADTTVRVRPPPSSPTTPAHRSTSRARRAAAPLWLLAGSEAGKTW